MEYRSKEAGSSTNLAQLQQLIPLQVFFLGLIILCSFSRSLALRHERLVDTWRPVHYVVDIKLNDQLSEIEEARTEINIVAVKMISIVDLDFGDLKVDSVAVNSLPAKFQHTNGLLAVTLAEPAKAGARLTVTVAYHGEPKDGLMLTADKDGKPSAIGDNWPNRVHQWIPCLDHPSAKATVRFTVTAPAKDLVVANGQLDHVENGSRGRRTWTYNEGIPIPPYCMVIAVGEFATAQPAQGALPPLMYFVPQADSQAAMKGFSSAMPAVQLFSQTVAPYPYEKLALIVGATRFGGMENSSAIVFASTLFNPNSRASVSQTYSIPMNVVSVVAHEIAHQWFGDSVTESTWADLWLSEGFATYFAGLFIQRNENEQAFRDYMRKAAETYFAYEKKSRTPIFDRDTEDLFQLLNANNYQKGAWVLHMLRSSVGDQAFFQGIRNYYGKHKSGTATSEDLRAELEKTSGQDLKGFFASWIYGTGHPEYNLTWKWQSGERKMILTLKQLQKESAFSNSLPLEILTVEGKWKITLKPRGKLTIESVRLPARPLSISVDPDNTVLKELVVKAVR